MKGGETPPLHIGMVVFCRSSLLSARCFGGRTMEIFIRGKASVIHLAQETGEMKKQGLDKTKSYDKIKYSLYFLKNEV